MSNMAEKTKQIQTIAGKVVSNKMNKSVVVLYTTKIKHKLYDKYVTHRTKLMAHDEDNTCKEGDLVMIQSCKPLSRKKRWKVTEVISKRKEV